MKIKIKNYNLIISQQKQTNLTKSIDKLADFKNKKNIYIIGKLLILILLIEASIYGTLFLFSSFAQAISIDITAEQLIELTNQERKKNNLSPFYKNQQLENAALSKAGDLLSKNYFSHTSPSGKPFYKWIQEADYQYQSAGENLAVDFINDEEVVKAWMKSPRHRDNILNPEFKEIGIAVTKGKLDNKNTAVVVQVFGEPDNLILDNAGRISSTKIGYQQSDTNIIAQESNKTNFLSQTNNLLNIISLTLLAALISIFIRHNKIWGNYPKHSEISKSPA